MHFSPVVHTFLYSPNTFLSEFTKISSIPDHMWQGHLIVPGQQNNVPGRMKLLFWAKSAVKRYWFVPDIPRILYKTLLAHNGMPNIDIFTHKYISPQKKLIFAKCPGEQKWSRVSKWPSIIFFFKRVKNALETICGLINEQRKSKRKKKLGSWMSSHWCNFYFVVPGHQICQKPRLICQIRWPIIVSSLGGI